MPGFTFSQCHGHSGDDVAIRSLEISRATKACDRYTLEISLIVTVTSVMILKVLCVTNTTTDIVFAYS